MMALITWCWWCAHPGREMSREVRCDEPEAGALRHACGRPAALFSSAFYRRIKRLDHG